MVTERKPPKSRKPLKPTQPREPVERPIPVEPRKPAKSGTSFTPRSGDAWDPTDDGVWTERNAGGEVIGVRHPDMPFFRTYTGAGFQRKVVAPTAAAAKRRAAQWPYDARSQCEVFTSLSSDRCRMIPAMDDSVRPQTLESA